MNTTMTLGLSRLKIRFDTIDPRIPVAAILFTYLVLGLTFLGFNRSPTQAILTTLVCCSLEVLFTYLFSRKWIFPLSAMITSFSLSFLLNYSHDSYVLLVPAFLAIGSKYLFQLNGKHFFNPAMFAVSVSLLISQNMITSAPAYQWNGIAAMSLFIIMLGLFFVLPKVNRQWLIASFLITFTLQTALRAFIMRHHLPFSTLFFGTLSSPSFFIFTFFMITDPATSPKTRNQQIIVGVSLALVDLLLHLRQSYFTFFYAALIVGSVRFIWFHAKALKAEGWSRYFHERFVTSRYYQKPLTLLAVGAFGFVGYEGFIAPQSFANLPNWHFEKVDAGISGLDADREGEVLRRLDPRIQHIAKWLLAETEGIAVGDFDGDGKLDLFMSNSLKAEGPMLYRATSEEHFEKISIPALEKYHLHPEIYGIVSAAMFVDYDNDGDQDLFVTVVHGHCVLLKNLLKETGRADFEDVTTEVGLDQYSQSISASFADFNRDGLLDLFVANAVEENLPNYESPQVLNLFHLPLAKSENDDRPFDFMHDSWNLANNGGVNKIYVQTADHKFVLQDSKTWGIPETRWSLALGVADLNQDGWPDIYVANDFGPDDLYFNQQGHSFKNIKGTIFGSIGRDTYKGMDVSIADFDHSGWLSVYVSNVHHALQAEGSLLWTFADSGIKGSPEISETATRKGALNEDRFGWGAAAADFDNDGWVDLAQANGMVDDTYDKKFDSCPDYWYVNEKIARSPPAIHRYANHWGDIRGYCIFGKEQNRIYMNRGPEARPQFFDRASELGVTELTNSRGVVSADFANSGRLDLVFNHPFSKPTFYRNKLNDPKLNSNHWIGLQLEGNSKDCNRDALGTRVDLLVTEKDGKAWRMVQEVQLVSGLLSQSDRRLHFGLGEQVAKVSAKVTWCGRSEKWILLSDLAMDRYHSVREDQP